jgi:hypothetical protein
VRECDTSANPSELPLAIAELVSVCHERETRLEAAEAMMVRLEALTMALLASQQQQYQTTTTNTVLHDHPVDHSATVTPFRADGSSQLPCSDALRTGTSTHRPIPGPLGCTTFRKMSDPPVAPYSPRAGTRQKGKDPPQERLVPEAHVQESEGAEESSTADKCKEVKEEAAVSPIIRTNRLAENTMSKEDSQCNDQWTNSPGPPAKRPPGFETKHIAAGDAMLQEEVLKRLYNGAAVELQVTDKLAMRVVVEDATEKMAAKIEGVSHRYRDDYTDQPFSLARHFSYYKEDPVNFRKSNLVGKSLTNKLGPPAKKLSFFDAKHVSAEDTIVLREDPKPQAYLVTIPHNVFPGNQFIVDNNHQRFHFICPPDVGPNMKVKIVPREVFKKFHNGSAAEVQLTDKLAMPVSVEDATVNMAAISHRCCDDYTDQPLSVAVPETASLSSTPPMKYMKVKGVTKLNPTYKMWKETNGEPGSTHSVDPPQTSGVRLTLDPPGSFHGMSEHDKKGAKAGERHYEKLESANAIYLARGLRRFEKLGGAEARGEEPSNRDRDDSAGACESAGATSSPGAEWGFSSQIGVESPNVNAIVTYDNADSCGDTANPSGAPEAISIRATVTNDIADPAGDSANPSSTPEAIPIRASLVDELTVEDTRKLIIALISSHQELLRRDGEIQQASIVERRQECFRCIIL